MRDQYAGDVSDVLKFAFLRALAGKDRTLGIAWYYASGDDRRSDSRHLNGAMRRHGRTLDEELHTGLATLPERSIAALERAMIWPKGARFHREPMLPRAGITDDYARFLVAANLFLLQAVMNLDHRVNRTRADE